MNYRDNVGKKVYFNNEQYRIHVSRGKVLLRPVMKDGVVITIHDIYCPCDVCKVSVASIDKLPCCNTA